MRFINRREGEKYAIIMSSRSPLRKSCPTRCAHDDMPRVGPPISNCTAPSPGFQCRTARRTSRHRVPLSATSAISRSYQSISEATADPRTVTPMSFHPFIAGGAK
ncbi:hypothetical protein [Croceicoccus sp. YJ47]|uniref:hypothetical protein n=1 Tax=Croceicoccus sp. YJ47 TaxID=2798724 RepID=UPI00192086E4|nr:hypothetical protein [Croceicoccus sp. YJ47]QQN75228.1 hypothetical protein JD971_06060 [Croceicoccus sp. YJ47]